MNSSDPLTRISTRRTPQSVPATPDQVPNHAGGHVFEITPEQRLRRFLIIGTSGGTYYQGEAELTRENASAVIDFAATDPARLVEIIREVSLAGRAPKQQPTIFALAVAAASERPEGRAAAFAALPDVLRTGTHLMLFAKYVTQFRGWGSGLMRAARRWYDGKEVDALAYQLVKYRSREGFSQRDLLRLIHPKTDDQLRNALYRWITQDDLSYQLPRLVHGFVAAQAAESATDWVRLIKDYRLSWEMLPDAALTEREVWEALIEVGLPMTALIRQLPRLTRLEVIGNALRAGDRTDDVVAQLTDPERLSRARIHPFNVLVALRTYAAGRSFRGSSTWTPARPVLDALDAAYYASFGNVVPANRRTMIGLDVSGSMMARIAGGPLTAREASAAMSMITVATEPMTAVYGFTSAAAGWQDRVLTELPIGPRQRLEGVIDTVSGLPFGGTDCALPMIKALELGLEVDTFLVITDSETWAGSVHPHQALAEYRRKTGIPAKLVVWGMTSTGFSIADPRDSGMLDLVGVDSAAPQLLADFSRGDL
ncbi:TROVE domain-containing protein [Microlunatus speluncae]|uniref:TROVE domain-containing protein n=1 Tax=Microlunatus speluncae TaxID=2594267 RepID=UPI0012666FC8|nr:TROVE domain-containing protein [Microlunatus speluncae]